MSEIQSIWAYNPSFPLAVTGTILYGVVALVIGYLTIFRYRSWYFLTVVVGAAIEVSGYGLRAYSTQNQLEVAPFAVTLSLVVLAPIFVAAGNFLLVGRLVRAVLPRSRHTIFRLPARFITHLFVTCDVTAFFIQGSGSGVATGGNWQGTAGRIGVYVLVGGLSFQFLAFLAYLCVFVRFHLMARHMAIREAPSGWINVVRAVYISSSMIMIRCIYRVVEFAQGTEGYAYRNEWMFWIFECLPMLIAIGIFCWWHPSRYLGKDGAKAFIINSGESSEASELTRQPRGYERMQSHKP